MAGMTSWTDFTTAAPDLADRARARFDDHGLAIMATLRADGAPRISGVEPLVALDELWLGMMPGGRKSADLRRDPRLALHNATVDKDVKQGDVKVSGRAVAVTDAATIDRYRAEFERGTETPSPPGPFDLWRLDVTEVAMITPGGDHLVIETWRPGGPVHRIERR
jgi:Pyridoxamine 5'-phosphate oxidase